MSQNAIAAAASVDPSHLRRWWILLVISLSMLMGVLDGTIVNIALPSAQHDLGFSDADRQWVVTPTRWPSAACCCSVAGSRTWSLRR